MEFMEMEVKFHLEDLHPVRQFLEHQAAASGGRGFETNIRFEDAHKGLLARGSLLRLRREDKATLTFKSRPAVADPEVKALEELEVEVGSFEVTARILEALGFHREQVYEKWRETFTLEGATLCLDEMPYGRFLEIEGEKAQIRTVAQRLGLDWERRILANYLEIFDYLRRQCGLAFTDLTFANFAAVSRDFGPLIRRFEGGGTP